MPVISNTQASGGLTTGRIAANGQTALGIAAVVDVTTLTRQPNERLIPMGFVTDDVANIPFADETGAIGIGADAVILQMRKTGGGINQAKLTLRSGISGRTCDWLVMGLRP